jgi:hypothetical protein
VPAAAPKVLLPSLRVLAAAPRALAAALKVLPAPWQPTTPVYILPTAIIAIEFHKTANVQNLRCCKQ